MNQTDRSANINVLYFSSMILALAFFLMICIIYKGPAKKGAAISEKSWSENVILENGKSTTPVYSYDYDIPKDGVYKFELEWDVAYPGFITGIVVKDAGSNVLFAFTAAQVTYENQLTLDAGRICLEYHILANEAAYREFAKSYELFGTESELDSMIKGIDFSSFPQNGEWDLRQSIAIFEMQTAPQSLYFVLIAIGLVTASCFLALCVLSHPSEGTMNEALGSIGRIYANMVILVTFVQISTVILLSFFAKDFTLSLGTGLSFLLIILGVDVIGFPITFLLCKEIPGSAIPKRKLGFGNFLLFVLMGAGLCGVGGIIGSIFHAMLTLPFNNTSNGLADLMLASDMPIRVLTVGILAPIFEELLFRKLLIDRLSKYGEFIAVLTSGLMFGLFHGNFSQFFFATALGLLWGFVYIRTGNILYTMLMHMTINMSTSAITVYLLGKLLEYLPNTSDTSAMIAALSGSEEAALYIVLYFIWILLLGVCCIAGFIIFLVFFSTGKFRLRKMEEEASGKELVQAFFGNKYMLLFFVACIGLFLINYLPGILAYMLS